MPQLRLCVLQLTPSEAKLIFFFLKKDVYQNLTKSIFTASVPKMDKNHTNASFQKLGVKLDKAL